MTAARVGDLEVRWLGGALWVRHADGTLLIDAPSGVDALLPDDGVDAVLVTSGRIEAIGGLLPLFARLDGRRRGAPLPLHAPLGDERAAGIVDVWTRLWPRGFPVDHDARRPGAFDVAPFLVSTAPLLGGEPAGDGVVGVPVVGVRLRADGATLAFAPACRPGTAVERLVQGADLAVVTAGVRPLPRSEGAWRASPEEAARLAAGARAGWVVGDDGGFLGRAAPPN